MNVRFVITLTEEERSRLRAFVQAGSKHVRRVKRVQVLLAAEAGMTDQQIATSVSVGTSTVFRTKRRFVEEGLEAALSEAPRAGGLRKLSTKEEALLTATACSSPPSGWAHLTLSRLAGRMVELREHEELFRETVRRIPDKQTLTHEIAAWEARRNTERARIRWLFTVERARHKLARSYPEPSSGRSDIAA